MIRSTITKLAFTIRSSTTQLPSFYFSKQSSKLTKSDNLQPQFKNVIKKDGVFIDEQKIRQKMKQIKQRTHVEELQKKKKKSSQEFMKNYQIVKDVPKIRKFRADTQTQNLMSFQDATLDDKPTTLQITSYNESIIQIDQFPYPPRLIVTPNQVFLWQVSSIQQISVKHLKLIEMILPPPSYVIIGSPRPQIISQNKQIRQYLDSLKINFDIIGMFQAVSQFNNYANDQIKVLAFLFSGKENQ